MNIQAITEFAVGSPSRPQPVVPTVPGAANGGESSQLVAEAQPANGQDKEPDEKGLEKVLDGINTLLRSGENHIQFALHEKAQRLMVQVIDNETQEVVRTFPSEELLDLAARIGEMVGTLIDQKG